MSIFMELRRQVTMSIELWIFNHNSCAYLNTLRDDRHLNLQEVEDDVESLYDVFLRLL